MWGNQSQINRTNPAPLGRLPKGQTSYFLFQMKCNFDVPNCGFCDNYKGLLNLDYSQLNVECKIVNGRYQYIFSNKTSDTISLTKSSTTSQPISVKGNFMQVPNTTLNFIVTDNEKGKIITDDCISLNGDLTISIPSKPSSQRTIPLFNFTCSDSPLKSTRSVKVVPTYSTSKCEKLKFKTNEQQSFVSVTFSSVTDCGGLSSGEVAAIVLCTLLFAGIITVGILVYLKKRNILFKNRLRRVEKEMK
jgi:hypothetical protein